MSTLDFWVWIRQQRSIFCGLPKRVWRLRFQQLGNHGFILFFAAHFLSQTKENQVYYFNFVTGDSIWEHPCDAKFKEKVQLEREKYQTQASTRLSAPSQKPAHDATVEMSKNHTESKTLPPLLISKSLKPTGVKQLEPISSSTPSDIPNRPMGRDQSIHSEANKGGEAGDVAAMEEVMHQHLDDMQRVRQQFAQKLLDVEREENALVEVEAKRIQTQHRLKLTSLHESCVEEFQKLSVSLKLEYAIKTQQEQQLLERQLHEQRERGKESQHDQKRGEEESSLHYRRIDTLTSAHQVELDGLSLHHLHVVDKMKVGQAEELKQLQLQHDKAQTDLDAQHLHATTDNRDEHQKTLQNLLSIQHVESEHFKREVESTKAKRIDQLHHQLDSEILKLESEMTDALASKRSKLHEEFKPMLDGERKEFEREIEAKRMGWKKELKHLQEQIDQDFERVRSEGESRLRHFQTQSFSNENDGNAQELHPRHLTHQPSHPPKKVDDKSTSFGENANSTDSPCEDSDVQSLVEEVEDNFHTTLTSSPHRTIQHYLQQESRQIQSVKQLIKEQTRSMHQRHQELNKVRKQWQHQLPPHQFTTSVFLLILCECATT